MFGRVLNMISDSSGFLGLFTNRVHCLALDLLSSACRLIFADMNFSAILQPSPGLTAVLKSQQLPSSGGGNDKDQPASRELATNEEHNRNSKRSLFA